MMKPLILCLLAYICLSNTLFAQKDTIYFSEGWVRTNREHAHYYRISNKEAEQSYLIEDHYMVSNVVQMRGHQTGPDSGKKNGDFVFFDEHGVRSSSGQYLDDKRIGVWYLYNSKGELWFKRQYKRGYLNGIQTCYFWNGKVKTEEYYKLGRFLGGRSFDEHGLTRKYVASETQPSCPYDVKDYFSGKLIYNDSDLAGFKSAFVFLRCQVDVNGAIIRVAITKGLSSKLDSEAVRAARQMPAWSPGLLDGIPAKLWTASVAVAFPRHYLVDKPDTVYFDKDSKRVEKQMATFYLVAVKKNDSLYKTDGYYASGQLSYSGYASEILPLIRTGLYTYYGNNGFVIAAGQYDSSVKVGEWKYFYPRSGELWYKEPHDKKGNLDGFLVSYYPGGQLKRRDFYDHGRYISGTVWDDEGKKLEHTPFIIQPEASMGINEYFSKALNYPDSENNRDHYGNVRLGFSVDTNGQVCDIVILKSVNMRIDSQVVHALGKMPAWTVGKKDGIPARVDLAVDVNLPLYISEEEVDTTYIDSLGNECSIFTAKYLKTSKRLRPEEYEIKNYDMEGKIFSSGVSRGRNSSYFTGKITFFDEDGNIRAEGMLSYGRKDGEMKTYYKGSENVRLIEHYKNGKYDGVLQSFYKSGKKRRDELYRDGKSISGRCWKENGVEEKFTPLRTEALASYNLDEYLAKNIHYPGSARNSGEQGRVIIGLMVDADGQIIKATIVRSLSESLDAEALRVVQELPAWSPATFDGIPIASVALLPVDFKLD